MDDANTNLNPSPESENKDNEYSEVLDPDPDDAFARQSTSQGTIEANNEDAPPSTGHEVDKTAKPSSDAAGESEPPSSEIAEDAEPSSDKAAENHPGATRRSKAIRRILITVAIVMVLAIAIGAIVMFFAKSFTAQESEIRSDWSVSTGEMIENRSDLGVTLYDAGLESNLRILRIVPAGGNAVGFTYYDDEVQDRLANTLIELQQCGLDWRADHPLAVLNPFGTGANALYLYFTTNEASTITYTISAEGTSDFTVTANDIAVEGELEADAAGNTRTHSFQMVGLVPGKTNNVTMSVVNAQGTTARTVTFSVEMPCTDSGYPTMLESTEGTSSQPLSDGLYALMRTNGYLGYGFFFDNDGVMRYEMVTEGFGLDRMLMYEDETIVCTSTQAISRIDGLGRIKEVYDLDGYELHHDINYGRGDTVVALAERTDRETVEDVVLEIDLSSGEVSELVDFSTLMADFMETYTHTILPTSTFFWQAGEWDWIHLNSVEYFEKDDSIIVSSRETSTIMKLANVHTDPSFVYFIGDGTVWTQTPYADLSLQQVGDFTPQYGQHAVEYDGEGPVEGSYYLLMYDNNYWANSTRDGYSPNLAGTDVSTDLYNGTASYVYRYLVNEDEGTFELDWSFPVPYSSIVSNASHAPKSGNYVVNSGIANIFGEYDETGSLIREFSYTCQLQGYRVFKDSFEGLWFAENS